MRCDDIASLPLASHVARRCKTHPADQILQVAWRMALLAEAEAG
jgi:hypothetical protein